jgi:hypothetical protein
MYDISAWDISKQYLAAHYYLSEERPISISEAQRAQLGALHLHTSFGPYNDNLLIPDLLNCTPAEKKKRVSEWKKLGMISRITAIKKFIDLINSLFPNWHKFRKLHTEFENEWMSMPETHNLEKNEKPKLILSKKDRRKEIEFRETTPNAFKKISEMKKYKRQKAKSRLVEKTNTTELIIKKNTLKNDISSHLPKIAYSFKQYKEKDADFLKNFLEDLQSYKGGNIRDTSATRLPKHVEDKKVLDVKYQNNTPDFDKELKNYRKKLLSQEFKKFAEKPEPASFQQAKIIPNLLEKIAIMKSSLSKIEDDYSKLATQTLS